MKYKAIGGTNRGRMFETNESRIEMLKYDSNVSPTKFTVNTPAIACLPKTEMYYRRQCVYLADEGGYKRLIFFTCEDIKTDFDLVNELYSGYLLSDESKLEYEKKRSKSFIKENQKLKDRIKLLENKIDKERMTE